MDDIIEYILYPEDSKPIQFRVSLDFFSSTYEFPNPELAPEWTKLGTHQCSHCPLSVDKVKMCPLAERLVPFVEKLSNLSSIDEMRVTITQVERVKQMRAPAQEILGSLLGLFIAILGYGIWMGLDVDCGCFGPEDHEAEAFHILKISLYRDLIMLAGVAFLYGWRQYRAIKPLKITLLINKLCKKRRTEDGYI